jgi:AmmeMemoRadiSam system protein A
MIIELQAGTVVLVRRKYAPPGWAIPGGFIEPGESAEQAAVREAYEETGLVVELTELFHVYSDPHRDPRHQTIGIVFLGRAEGAPVGSDDAAEARVYTESDLPADMAFDHGQILADYFRYRRTGQRPAARSSGTNGLSESEKKALLELARTAIRSALSSDRKSESSGARTEDDEPASVFVTLHRGAELRGCVGTLSRDRPLRAAVHDMAVAAASQDPRFRPLTLDELDLVTIEISVLSMPILAAPENVVPGLHGVSISSDGHRGVLLPHVAREQGWDRETLLAETCRKAGLDTDAWSRPGVMLRVFWADVFAEKR